MSNVEFKRLVNYHHKMRGGYYFKVKYELKIQLLKQGVMFTCKA